MYGEQEEHQRPRRANPDTVAYLASLPLDVKVANDEVDRFLSGGGRSVNNDEDNNNEDRLGGEAAEFPPIFAAALSAIDEIKGEVASLSGEERGSQVLEVLARIACPRSEIASRILLQATSGYRLHMSTHRYGSHVLQTILQLATASSPSSPAGHPSDDDPAAHRDLALHDDAPPLSWKVEEGGGEEDNNAAPSSLPALTELVVGVQEELTPHAQDLAIHICGSHVLRTLICVLGGVRLLQQERVDHSTGNLVRRIKNKKKKKKGNSSQGGGGGEAAANSSKLDVAYEPNSRVMAWDSTVRDAMRRVVESLTDSTETASTAYQPAAAPGELQTLVCHASAGPLLIVLLRALTYRDAPKEWKQRDVDKSRDGSGGGGAAGHHLAKLRPEPTFSEGSEAYKMATRILCWKDDGGGGGGEEDGQGTQPQEKRSACSEVIYGLAGESHGSHMLEVLLQLSPDELHGAIVKSGDFLSHSTLKEYVEHDVGNFIVQSILATTRNSHQLQKVLTALRPLIVNGFLVDASRKRRGILWRAVEAVANYHVNEKEILTHIRDGFQSLRIDESQQCKGFADCVPLLVDMKPPSAADGRIRLDVTGARTVHHLLRFEPKYCRDTLKGILRLSSTDLELLAKDGLGSRCLWDGILESPSVKDPVFASAIKQIFLKLKGRWVSLASDRIGHHSVKKIFKALNNMNDRRQLVDELSHGKARLNGCAMGRSVMEVCYMQTYVEEGENEWRKKVTKMVHKEKLLKEIEAAEPSAARTKKKRKRKRGKSSNKGEGEEEGEGVAGDSAQGNKERKTSTVSSIMDTLTMPSGKKRDRV